MCVLYSDGTLSLFSSGSAWRNDSRVAVVMMTMVVVVAVMVVMVAVVDITKRNHRQLANNPPPTSLAKISPSYKTSVIRREWADYFETAMSNFTFFGGLPFR